MSDYKLSAAERRDYGRAGCDPRKSQALQCAEKRRNPRDGIAIVIVWCWFTSPRGSG
jgi:hypothetical protein